MQYQLITDSECIKMIDGNGVIKCIPNDERNTDWQEYQAWLAADPENQPEPAEE